MEHDGALDILNQAYKDAAKEVTHNDGTFFMEQFDYYMESASLNAAFHGHAISGRDREVWAFIQAQNDLTMRILMQTMIKLKDAGFFG